MSEFSAYLGNTYVIKQGTAEHRMFRTAVTEVFEAMNDKRTTVLTTKGEETLMVLGISEPTLEEPEGHPVNAVLMSREFGAKLEISRELFEDAEVDLGGYLAMSGGRALGNQLHVASLDGGDGRLFVRLAKDFDITVTRYSPDHNPDRMIGFEVKVLADVARES